MVFLNNLIIIQQQLDSDKGGGHIYIGNHVKTAAFTITGRQSSWHAMQQLLPDATFLTSSGYLF